MKLCAVQLASRKGDLQGNLDRHLRCIEQAAGLGAELVVFPELSLTGYEPSLARQVALPLTSARLEPLQVMCDRLNICVAVGLPLPTAEGVQIGMPILRPGQPRLAYAKQRLHADELAYFAAGDQPMVFAAGRLNVAPAICYESMFIEHAAHARSLGAQLYLVSVAKTAKGIREGNEHYPHVARTLGIPVLMANCVGPADNFVGAGGSAAWDNQGNVLAALDDRQEGMIVLDTVTCSAMGLPLHARGMKYLLLILASFASTYYLVGLLIQGQLADIAEGCATARMPHRPGNTCVKCGRMHGGHIGSTH